MSARPRNVLPRWQRLVVEGAALALLVTGVAWLPLHHLWGPGAGKLPHPLEAWLMRAHGLAALVGVFALGLVAAGHVVRGWALARRRASGAALGSLALALVLSGWALWYVVPEDWHGAVGWAHAGVGLLAAVLGLSHAWGRAERSAEEGPPTHVRRAARTDHADRASLQRGAR